MKTTLKSLAILMMAAAGLTACSDDDNTGNAALKEYALDVKFDLTPNDSTVEIQLQKAVEAAMSSIGISSSQPYLYLSAKDSADAAPKVQEIGKKLEAVLYKNASQMNGDVYLMAVEKQQLEANDSKQRSWSCWYEANYPAAENILFFSPDWFDEVFYAYHLEIYNETSHFHITPGEKVFNEKDPRGKCVIYTDQKDMNLGVGGDYLYLQISGVSNPAHPDYKDKLITDMIMLNTGNDSHYPEYVDIPTAMDGKVRRYYPVFTSDRGANGSVKHDLNCKAGGPYLWLYYTTDKRDGWVLSSNAPRNGLTLITRIFSGKEFGQESTNVKAYKKNASGEWVANGNANLNEGVAKNSKQNLYLQQVFRKVQ